MPPYGENWLRLFMNAPLWRELFMNAPLWRELAETLSSFYKLCWNEQMNSHPSRFRNISIGTSFKKISLAGFSPCQLALLDGLLLLQIDG
jgi:hypothetical protein